MADTALAAIRFLRDTAILADTDIGERIYMSIAPQPAVYPLAVMEIVSRTPSPTQDSGSAVDTYRIQVDVFAQATSESSAFEQASTIAHDLRVAWSREAGDTIDSIQEDSYFSDYLADQKVQQVSNDYMIRVLPDGEVMATQIIKRTKITKTFEDFSTAASTNSVSAGFDLPAGGVVHDVVFHPEVTFSGGAISSYRIGVGIAGNTTYLSAANILASSGATTIGVGSSSIKIPSMTATTPIILSAVSIGADLDQATQGEVEIWIYYSELN
jgi:hypothetical protein